MDQIKRFQKEAKDVLKYKWKEVAKRYTLGWGGPLLTVETSYPHISEGLNGIRDCISENLPIVIFQTRESPPKIMITVVPYKSPDGNPYNARIIQSESISQKDIRLLNEFSQALWYLLDTGALPKPWESKTLQHKLEIITGKTLFKI